MQQIAALDARGILARIGVVSGGDSSLDAQPGRMILDLLMAGMASTGDNLFLGGGGSAALFALDRREVPWEEALSLGFEDDGPARAFPDAVCGLAGILSFDDLRRTAYVEQAEVSRIFKPAQSRIEAILSGVWFDPAREQVWIVAPAGRRAAATHRFEERLVLAREAIRADQDSTAPRWGEWEPQCAADSTDDLYLRRAGSVIESIRNGDFYQLNLLRFFQIADGAPVGWPERRLEVAGGPFSCIYDIKTPQGDETRVVSFSPEQFVQVLGQTIETFPVKGTISRDADMSRDAENARRLLSSAKDLAELHMIVDLMRNDFNRICEPGSVKVPVPHEIRSHANVHHLHAKVRGTLRAGTTLAGLIGALCPAGSITGAPKLAVMDEINRLEERGRGYHMGHVFHWRPDGGFNSSVLIRTLVRHGCRGVRTGSGRYELAAGSGIVIHSDPAAEMAEIGVKARVATAPLRGLSLRN